MFNVMVRLRFFRLSYGIEAVTIQQDRTINGRYNSQLNNKLSQLYHLFYSIRCSNVFHFAYRIGHSMLLETLPANSSSIQSCWCKNLPTSEKLESRESRSPSGLQKKSKPEVGLLWQDPPMLKSVLCLNKNGVLKQKF